MDKKLYEVRVTPKNKVEFGEFVWLVMAISPAAALAKAAKDDQWPDEDSIGATSIVLCRRFDKLIISN